MPAAPSAPALEVALVDGVELAGDEVEAEATPRQLEVSGAKVMVAGKTKVRVARRTRREVRLELTRGEVTLAVSHREAGQAFVVATGTWETHVVGTQFSVRRVGERVEVEVTEGQVRVRSADASFDVPAGQAFRAEGGRGGLVGPAPTLEVDAGVPPVEPASSKATGPDAKELARWRNAAARGSCAQIVAEVKRAVARFPKSDEAWRVLADCQRLTKDDEGAVASYAKVAALAPREEADRARLLLADLHQQRGEHAKAVEVLRVYLSHAPPGELEAATRVRLATSLLALGERAKAKAELQRVTKKLPSTAAALQALQMLKGL